MASGLMRIDHDETEERTQTELVILDAMHFERAPVAAVGLPHCIPPGVQGNRINQGQAQ